MGVPGPGPAWLRGTSVSADGCPRAGGTKSKLGITGICFLASQAHAFHEQVGALERGQLHCRLGTGGRGQGAGRLLSQSSVRSEALSGEKPQPLPNSNPDPGSPTPGGQVAGSCCPTCRRAPQGSSPLERPRKEGWIFTPGGGGHRRREEEWPRGTPVLPGTTEEEVPGMRGCNNGKGQLGCVRPRDERRDHPEVASGRGA